MARVNVKNGVAEDTLGNLRDVDVSSLDGSHVRVAEIHDDGSYWLDKDPFRESSLTDEEIVLRLKAILDEAEAKRLAPPQEVSTFQAEQALADIGRLDEVEALMKGPAVKSKSVRAWRKANTFRRDSPTILEFAVQLGLTEEQLDDLFRYASTIEA